MRRGGTMRGGLSVLAAAALAVIEKLEDRAFKSIALIGDQLHVRGTVADDAITVDANDNPGRLRVQVNGMIRRFNTADVASIIVSGLDGDDDIAIAQSVAIRTSIFGHD